MTFTSINKANLGDCADLFIRVFNNAPWNESWKEEVVTRRLEDCFGTPGFLGLMVRDEEEVIGFALGNVEQWDKAPHFYLKEMCVASKRQSSGVGTALLEALEEELRQQGLEKLYLMTARETVAQAFYEKRGFTVSPRMIMMSKWLTAR